jgi:radical SAM superfamily enzyme YgiQ (UPF0313 family)
MTEGHAGKTKAQLIKELQELHQQGTDLNNSESIVHKLESSEVRTPLDVKTMEDDLNILLVNPPFSLTGKRVAKGAAYTDPPLGIAYIAACIKKYTLNNVVILDAAAEVLDIEQVLDAVKNFQPDIVGCTTVTATAVWVKEFLGKIKKFFPDTLTVAGGPHPTALPFDLMPEADVCVLGEGEATMLDIIMHRQNQKPLDEVKGIAYRRGEADTITGVREFISEDDLDAMPFPAWDLLPMHLYKYPMPYKTKTKNYATVYTARGCPFDCTFCGATNMWGRQVRYRSPASVIAEVKVLVAKHGVSFIFFFDSTMTINRQRLIDIINGIRDLGIKWACFSRVDGIDEELLRIMKRAGCVEIQIGVESGDEQVLRVIQKNITIDKVRRVFALTNKVGINTKGFFMIGNESETPETVNKTIKLALELKPTYAFFSILIPFPGMPIFNKYKSLGYIKTYDWSKYLYYTYPVFSTPTLSDVQMKALQQKAEKRFYLRPTRMVRYVLDFIRTGKVRTLLRNFKVFMDIVSNKRDASVDA